MSRGRCSRSHGSSQWSPWRCETYRKSARLDARRAGRRRAGRCAGTGTTSRGTPGRTTGRTRSSRGRTRSGSRRGRSRSPLMPARPTGGRRRSGDGRVGVLLAVARHVLGPRRAVPVAQLVAAGRVVVPAGGHGRRGRLGRRRRRRCGRGGARRGLRTPTRRGACRCSTPTRCRSAPDWPHDVLRRRRRRPAPCPIRTARWRPPASGSAAAEAVTGRGSRRLVGGRVGRRRTTGAGALHVGRDVAARPARWRRRPSRQRTSR